MNCLNIIYCYIGLSHTQRIQGNSGNFQIIENGDFVICAVSGKKISLEDLTYWNVDLQEPYFSYKEAFIKKNNEGK